jgi:hypothetical protein
MADYDDDLNLSGSPTEPPYRPNNGVSNRTAWIVTVIILLAIAAIVYFFIFRARRVVVPPPGQPTATAPPETQAPQHVNPEDVGLPSLDESDSVVRNLAHGLSSHPELATWLATDDLIRNFAVMIDNVADGNVPISRLRQFAPREPLHANQNANQIVLDPASYARFNAFAEAVASLDTNGSAAAYDRLKPLLVVAYKDLGHPEGDIDGALQKGIVNLLKTPVVEGPIFLTQPAVAYQFSDPQLAGLLPVQKQLIRMGPRNQRLIQGKLRELAVAIGIPASSLPETPTVRP